jgi:hypothetical protein
MHVDDASVQDEEAETVKLNYTNQMRNDQKSKIISFFTCVDPADNVQVPRPKIYKYPPDNPVPKEPHPPGG